MSVFSQTPYTGVPSSYALPVVVMTPSSSVTITSPPTTGTTGTAMNLAGTVSPSGTAVTVGLSTTVNATVTGTAWTASVTPSTAGTYYIWAQSGSAAPAVSAAVTIASGSTALTFSLVSGSPGTGGISTVTPSSSYAVNMVTPIAHGTAVTPAVTFAQASGNTLSTAQFWYDTSATASNPSGGTVASGTLNSSVGGSTGISFFNPAPAPASAGTYYAKYQFVTTGTDSGTYTFVSQAVTVT